MKRTFVFALALVLLLTVGVLAAPPIKRGPQNDSASVPFTINILPYAEVKLDDNKLFHGDILGRVGLYTSDEWQVLANAKTHFAAIVGREITAMLFLKTETGEPCSLLKATTILI